MQVKISDSIKYIGVDDKTIDLFESQYLVPNGISYNSYLIVDEKVAIMDTVDKRKTNEWLENLDRPLLYRLRTMTREDIAKLPDVGEGLENRIADAAVRCSTSSEIADLVKTKRYTHARIRRILACALLGIEKAHTQIPIEYVRVLGFTNEGAELLKDCRLNIVTSASNGIRTGGNTKALLEKDILAYDISALAYEIPKRSGLDFTTPIVKI